MLDGKIVEFSAKKSVAGREHQWKLRTTGITFTTFVLVASGGGGMTGEVALLEYREAPVQGSLPVATAGGGVGAAEGARYLEAPRSTI